MISTIESLRSHHLVPRRRAVLDKWAAGRRIPLRLVPGTRLLQSCGGSVQQRYCTRPAHLASHCATLATTLPGTSAAGAGKRCTSPRAYSPDFSPQGPSRRSRHPAHDAVRRHSLERAKYGQGPGAEQRHHSSDLEAAQPETAPFVETFKLSRDKRRLEKLHDVVGSLSEPTRTKPWCSASTRKAKSRPSTALSRSLPP